MGAVRLESLVPPNNTQRPETSPKNKHCKINTVYKHCIYVTVPVCTTSFSRIEHHRHNICTWWPWRITYPNLATQCPSEPLLSLVAFAILTTKQPLQPYGSSVLPRVISRNMSKPVNIILNLSNMDFLKSLVTQKS